MEPLHMHKLLGHDVERRQYNADHPTGDASARHRVLDVAYCERERTFHFLVLNLETFELDVWMPTGVRILPPLETRHRELVPHRNGNTP